MALTLCDLLVQGLHLIPKLLILLPKLFNHLKFDRSLKIIISAQAILSTFTLIEPLVFSQLLTWYPTIFLSVSHSMTFRPRRTSLPTFSLIKPLMFFRLLIWYSMAFPWTPFLQPQLR